MQVSKLNKNLLALLENHESKERKPIVCLEGSSRSGKTWSWIEYVVNLQAQYPLVVSAFRHDASTHEEAAIRDFKSIMLEKYLALWEAGKWNATMKTFTFPNGGLLEFDGTNDPAKLHGPERDIAILNEVMEISYEAYRQIAARTRLMVIMDWNPSLNAHWVFERVLGRDDVLYVHSTYLDNPHLSDKQVLEIEATNPANPDNVRNGTSDPWFWEVYGLGKRGKREGAVFKHFDIVDDWPDRMNCMKWGFGLDFGFSNDECALVECAIFQGKLYLREWIYEKGLITVRSHAEPNRPSIQGRMEEYGFDKSWKIVADGARPDQIAELRSEGYNIVAGQKGKGSIVAGIDLMKRFPICVDRGSSHIQIEFEQYAWKKHPTGYQMAEPEDKYNHGIDGTRYWCMEELAGWQPVRHHHTATAVSGRRKKRY